MGYKQIPGSVDMFANEKGTFRIGLRNLYPDDNRLRYKRNYKNELLDKWPEVVVRTEEAEEELRMLVPEAIFKAHGVIPQQTICEEEDFELKDGKKYDHHKWHIDNIEYKGGKKQPYKGKPEPIDVESQSDESPDEPPKEPEASQPDEEPTAPPETTPEQNVNDNPLAKGSAELSAKEAVEIIESYEFEELEDLGFYTEDQRDRPRKTVQDAWAQKKAEAEE